MTRNKRIWATALALILCVACVFTFAACNITFATPHLIVTFDSEHKVYEGDTLDSLRQHLTVTFINAFAMESEATTYTLTGELTVGYSVLNVRYAGLLEEVTILVLAPDTDGDGSGNTGDDGGDDSGDNGGGSDGDDVEQLPQNPNFALTINKTFIEVNDFAELTFATSASESEVEYVFVSGSDCVTLSGRTLTAKSSGKVTVYVRIDGKVSNAVELQIVDPANDPYKSTSFNSFHGSSYDEATSLEDSYWRTKHNLMSGSIANQNEAPTVASNQPTSSNKFVRNSDATYLDNGNTYAVVDGQGKVVNKIYKFGAYVTLEEVAAYVYAFGDVPANYIASNSTSSLSGNAWKQFLRLNHNKYSNNNTGNYSYEPKLPESGPGGKLQYYEIDIGTTGTTCDPSYTPTPYNTGSKITRGAARIVYTRFYANGNNVDDFEYRYVFYTYNHYNDFQEYLNYQGGWGKIFGNVTNGGKLNSGSNPSPYVDVVRQSFSQLFK